MVRLRAVVHAEWLNALMGWVLTGVVALAAVESFLSDAVL